MSLMQRCIRVLPLSLVGLGLCAANGANAQINSINSAVIHARVFNDAPNSNFVSVNNYPSLISLSDTNVSVPGPTGSFANRHTWNFSNDGSTDYKFNNNGYFQASMTLNLSGTVSPRKEAGFLLQTVGGDGQFIVNTDGHEVVVFGGPLPFYSFNGSNGLTFNSGDTITLGMTYFKDSNGKNAIIYTANGINSPAQEFSNLEQGIITGSTLGGYLQVPIDRGNANNGATALFTNISIKAVPEPSAYAAFGLGLTSLGLLLRRRRK